MGNGDSTRGPHRAFDLAVVPAEILRPHLRRDEQREAAPANPVGVRAADRLVRNQRDDVSGRQDRGCIISLTLVPLASLQAALAPATKEMTCQVDWTGGLHHLFGAAGCMFAQIALPFSADTASRYLRLKDALSLPLSRLGSG